MSREPQVTSEVVTMSSKSYIAQGMAEVAGTAIYSEPNINPEVCGKMVEFLEKFVDRAGVSHPAIAKKAVEQIIEEMQQVLGIVGITVEAKTVETNPWLPTLDEAKRIVRERHPAPAGKRAKKAKGASKKEKTTKTNSKQASFRKKRKKTNATPVGTFEQESERLRVQAQALIDRGVPKSKAVRQVVEAWNLRRQAWAMDNAFKRRKSPRGPA
jgi:hypothetical protein